MPKHDVGSPKDIANKIKAKGLQKLRWFCQMCQKQCRDENGFKCHLTSESHERQMALFAQSPDKFVDSFSSEFEKGFMDLLTRRFGTRRIQANYVYNEYIQDKLHTHMNATMWQTLGDFVKYLGRTGKCTIEETDKGWFIQWINRDPEVVKRQEAAARRKQFDDDEAARHDADLANLVRAAQAAAEAGGGEAMAPRYTELQRDPTSAEAGGGIRISLATARPALLGAASGGGAASSAAASAASTAAAAASAVAGTKRGRLDVEEEEAEGAGSAAARGSGAAHPRLGGPPATSAVERLVAEDAHAAATRTTAGPSRFDRPAPTVGGLSGGRPPAAAPAPPTDADAADEPWLLRGIVVKVLNERVGEGRFYKAKAAVVDVQGDGFVGVLRVLDGGAVLKVDQADLQTVVPRRGGAARFVRGPHRGARAELLDIDEAAFSATMRLADGGAVVRGVEYEDFSRLADD